MKLRPNSMPTQIVSDNRESASKAAASLGREFVAWVSGIFMFLGIAAICRWVWPGKKGLADATTFIVFLLWITLISKLRVFPRSEATGNLVSGFLRDFILFFVWMYIWDVWRHDGHAEWGLEGSLVGALAFACFRAWSDRNRTKSSAAEST